MNGFLNLRTFLLAGLLTSTCPIVQAAEDVLTSKAESHFLPWEKGSVALGGFVAAFDDSIGFGVNNAAGVTINPEKLLGLDSTLAVFRVAALYRPGESLRNQVDFSYGGYHRSGSGTLSEGIIINGNEYGAGTQIRSHLNFDLIRGTYSYAVLQDERVRIALGVTVYAVPLSYGLEVNTPDGFRSVGGGSTTLPLPALALRSEFQLIPKLFLNGSIDAMYLEISNFKGSVLDVNVGLEYRPWKHFGFGLDYNAMSVGVEGESSHSSYPGASFVGTVNVRYSGLMLYGKFTF